ncbi:MAG: NAD(P)-binding protein, partial [Pseudomonadota bacterium]
MSQKFSDLKIALDEDLEEKLRQLAPSFSNYRILKKSVDARTKQKLHWVYTIEVFDEGETPEKLFIDPDPIQTKVRPIVVGTGPAGLFAAIRLTERGVPCDIFERGSPCDQRILAINKYWRYGVLNEEDNVCFGEGGAGLYSDGKLITRIKSPHIPYVMARMVDFGAPPEVAYLANPHIGSNKIRRLIPKMREYLISKGCRFFFNDRVAELRVENHKITGIKTASGTEHRSSAVILATGHSAEDIFEHLNEIGV